MADHSASEDENISLEGCVRSFGNYGKQTTPALVLSARGKLKDRFMPWLCPHARELWDAMSTVWPIPRKEQVFDSGRDWLLLLLAGCSDIARSMVVMLVYGVIARYELILRNF